MSCAGNVTNSLYHVQVPLCFFFTSGDTPAMLMCGPSSRVKRTGNTLCVVMATDAGVMIKPTTKMSLQDSVSSSPKSFIPTSKTLPLPIKTLGVYAVLVGRVAGASSARALIICYHDNEAVYVSQSLSLFYGCNITDAPCMPAKLPLLKLLDNETVSDIQWHPGCHGDVMDTEPGVAPPQLLFVNTTKRIVVIRITGDVAKPLGYTVAVLMQFFPSAAVCRCWWLGPILVYSTKSELCYVGLDGYSGVAAMVRCMCISS